MPSFWIGPQRPPRGPLGLGALILLGLSAAVAGIGLVMLWLAYLVAFVRWLLGD